MLLKNLKKIVTSLSILALVLTSKITVTKSKGQLTLNIKLDADDIDKIKKMVSRIKKKK